MALRIVSEDDLARFVDECLEKRGVTDALKTAQTLLERMDEILTLIENHPHVWTDNKDCQTCNAVSLLAGRKFGCLNRHVEVPH